MHGRVERRVVALTLSALALTTAGCAVGTGGTDDSDAQYDPTADLSGELSVMGFSGVDEVATARMELAEEAMPEVSVTLAEGDLDLQQLLSAVATGEPPDLVYANRDQIGSLAARGAVIPLAGCIEGEGIPTEDFVEPALAQVTLGGEVYGIPEFNAVQLTMANADLLGAAGLTIDDVNGSDWEAMSAASEAMTVGDGGSLSVIGVDSKLPEFLPLWAKANGVELISEDGRTANLDDPGVVEALEWAVSIYDDQGGFSAVKAYRDSADFFGEGNQFAAGLLGAMPMEQWYVNVLNDVSPDAPLAFDTVRDRSGAPVAYASGSAWAIPSGSDNAEAACRFARVMTSLDAWQAAAEARLAAREADGKPFTGILTGNTEADAMIQGMTTSGGEPWDTAVAAMYEANDNTFSLPANPADAEFKAAMFDAVNAVLNGQSDPETALAQAQQAAQEALDAGWADIESGE
ncbi:extracellular solute-binding protein [Microbacterium sp. zg.Y625]|uniref:ABC transporter substrate-binding protein n=1 Tax=Microbacterium jiangjiandongii TaxID=3049071 RepID=UPI00214ADA35|nr:MULTISPECIES: extracellular solute-binding protein [unclassified Microbacterium]MCR2791991.1 extracellular solute-binding protein [Microbacterium sp. zg.Y625]WIM24799.1 extracellular solute-binding protein [Microbacterium sp. zg-Y625]